MRTSQSFSDKPESRYQNWLGNGSGARRIWLEIGLRAALQDSNSSARTARIEKSKKSPRACVIVISVLYRQVRATKHSAQIRLNRPRHLLEPHPP